MKVFCCVVIVALLFVGSPALGQEPTETPTETPVATETPTATPTASATPNVLVYSTLSSGQAVVTEFKVNPVDQFIVAQLFFISLLLLVLIFLNLVQQK